MPDLVLAVHSLPRPRRRVGHARALQRRRVLHAGQAGHRAAAVVIVFVTVASIGGEPRWPAGWARDHSQGHVRALREHGHRRRPARGDAGDHRLPRCDCAGHPRGGRQGRRDVVRDPPDPAVGRLHPLRGVDVVRPWRVARALPVVPSRSRPRWTRPVVDPTATATASPPAAAVPPE